MPLETQKEMLRLLRRLTNDCEMLVRTANLEGMPTARGMIETDCREAREFVQEAQVLWGVK